ncbi:hypothetical protein KI688_004838 [Linnemannia hyalina]|uniref:Crinkler effector protein N-terminal domain-containing protein n=1 Tax=Linnemannia hyalina TaxID=64524 RepID=A0A9P8BNW5_9FUNG|nr:hypothetical protein KI688_004838 [Linnemannia hyalina]
MTEATSQALSVEINPKTVDGLKKVIKAEIPDTFNRVDAKDLTLWRSPKKTIHITVQRPPSAHAPLAVPVPVRARSSTPFSDESRAGTPLSGDLRDAIKNITDKVFRNRIKTCRLSRQLRARRIFFATHYNWYSGATEGPTIFESVLRPIVQD